jgi:hypothetical protein
MEKDVDGLLRPARASNMPNRKIAILAMKKGSVG